MKRARRKVSRPPCARCGRAIATAAVGLRVGRVIVKERVCEPCILSAVVAAIDKIERRRPRARAALNGGAT